MSHLSSCGQNYQFTELNNLDFENWMMSRSKSIALKVDSSVVRNGKSPMLIYQPSLKELNFPLRGGIHQRILMPETGADTAEVFLTCKDQNLAIAKLIVTGLNNMEDILYSDTIVISGKEDWYTFSMPVSLKGIEFLYFNIDVEGKGGNLEQHLYLDILNIVIDKKNFADFPIRKLDKVSIVDEMQIVPLSLSNIKQYNNLTDLNTHKIIALGETIHGSENISQAAFQLLKHQVESNQTNLILMELPLEETLSYNRFVQGDERFDIDSLMSDYNKLISPKLMEEFMRWLKMHNSTLTEDKKVWFLGMDMDITTQNSAMSLFDYVYKINLYEEDPALDSIARQLFKSNPYEKVLSILDRNERVKSLFGTKEEYNVFEHSLKILDKAGGSTSSRFNGRDGYMFENSKNLIDLLSPVNKKVAVYAHLGHVSYLNLVNDGINHQSAGSLLRQAFGDDYFVVSLIAEKGTFLSSDTEVHPLEKAPVNSLESLFDGIDGYYFYTPITAISGSLAAMRELGNSYRKSQFEIGSFRNRIGAIVFVRNSTAISYDKKPMDKNEMFMKKTYRNHELINMKKTGH